VELSLKRDMYSASFDADWNAKRYLLHFWADTGQQA